jgi:UPF0755 protein
MKASEFLGAISSTIIKIAVAAVVIVAVFRLSIYAYNFGFQVFADQPVGSGEGRNVNVIVSSDMSDMEISKLLEQKGLISDANVFFLQLKLSDGDIVAGVYDLNTTMSASEMLAIMSDTQEQEDEE